MTASPSNPPNSRSNSQSSSQSSAQANSQKSTQSPSQKNSQPDDFYTLLGLRPGVSVQDIRRAYRDLSKLYHPDTTELESAIATVKFQALNEAYATLSSPEKRLAYDYKIGYSRLSVMQPLSQQAPSGKAYNPTDSAYLDPTDRPLSAGELFALFILGVTFIACLILVFTMGLTKSELPITQGATAPSDVVSPDVVSPEVGPSELSPPITAPPITASPNSLSPKFPSSPAPNIPKSSRPSIKTLTL